MPKSGGRRVNGRASSDVKSELLHRSRRTSSPTATSAPSKVLREPDRLVVEQPALLERRAEQAFEGSGGHRGDDDHRRTPRTPDGAPDGASSPEAHATPATPQAAASPANVPSSEAPRPPASARHRAQGREEEGPTAVDLPDLGGDRVGCGGGERRRRSESEELPLVARRGEERTENGNRRLGERVVGSPPAAFLLGEALRCLLRVAHLRRRRAEGEEGEEQREAAPAETGPERDAEERTDPGARAIDATDREGRSRRDQVHGKADPEAPHRFVAPPAFQWPAVSVRQ